MSKRTEHIHLRVTPAMKREMRAEAKLRGVTVNRLAIDLMSPALGPKATTES